eukprot:1154832-Pelagomonas_calceolata.AAC.7
MSSKAPCDLNQSAASGGSARGLKQRLPVRQERQAGVLQRELLLTIMEAQAIVFLSFKAKGDAASGGSAQGLN